MKPCFKVRCLAKTIRDPWSRTRWTLTADWLAPRSALHTPHAMRSSDSSCATALPTGAAPNRKTRAHAQPQTTMSSALGFETVCPPRLVLDRCLARSRGSVASQDYPTLGLEMKDDEKRIREVHKTRHLQSPYLRTEKC